MNISKELRSYLVVFIDQVKPLNLQVWELYSKRIAMKIVCHIYNEVKNRIVKQILEVSGKISVLIDESTHLGSNFTLIIEGWN